MSCGPSKELLAVADQIDALNAQLDAAIMDIPGMGELAGLKGKVEGEAQKLKDKCEVEFNHSLNVDGKTMKVCRVKQLHIDKIEYKPVERKESNY